MTEEDRLGKLLLRHWERLIHPPFLLCPDCSSYVVTARLTPGQIMRLHWCGICRFDEITRAWARWIGEMFKEEG